MIGKLTKGSSHAGALRYDNQKEGALFLDTNCTSSDHNQIAGEMETVAASNPRCKNSCLHLSMSAPDGERLSDKQWRQAGAIARRELGLQDNQFSMTRHTDSNQDHVHITINRIDQDGRAWNDSKDFQRVHAAMRVVEKEMGLERIEDHEINRDGRFEQTKTDLDDSIKAARGKGLDSLKSEMKTRGYTVIANESKTTGTISGISIKSDEDGKTWKASELKKGGWRSIEKQLNSEQKTAEKSQPIKSSGVKIGAATGKTAANSIKIVSKMPTIKAPQITAAAVVAGTMKAVSQSLKKVRENER
jgi:hypothetical protein